MAIEINNENAESIATDVFAKITKAFSTSDYEYLIQNFPEIKKGITPALFKEAVENLQPMGEVVSTQYLGHLKKPDGHLILWKVEYEKKQDEDLLWYLNLSGKGDEVRITGLVFDR